MKLIKILKHSNILLVVMFVIFPIASFGHSGTIPFEPASSCPNRVTHICGTPCPDFDPECTINHGHTYRGTYTPAYFVSCEPGRPDFELCVSELIRNNCSTNCQLVPASCDISVTQTGTCATPTPIPTTTPTATPTRTPTATPTPSQACGNGVREGTEACDDGNSTNGDGCSATCTIETATPTPSTRINSWRTPGHAYPVVNFNWAPTRPAMRQNIQFTDQTQCYSSSGTGSGNPDTCRSWDWNFGDSNSSTTQNPTKAYTSANNYNVTLTVTDKSNQSCSLSKILSVGTSIPSWKEVAPR